MDNATRLEFLADLCPELRALTTRLMDCDGGCELVDFFRHRTFTWVQADDIAGQLHCPADQVVPALNRLVELGVLKRRVVLDWTFYSLTADTQILSALEQFWLVRDAWQMNVRQVQAALHLQGSAQPDVDFTRPIERAQNPQHSSVKPLTSGIEKAKSFEYGR